MSHPKTLAILTLLITFSLPSWAKAGLVCDINDDSFVDISDIRTIILNRNQPATGPEDPMDWDQNGVISITDARGCVLACSLPRCAETPVTSTNPTLTLDIKTFRFTWTDVPNATHYRLLENPDGISGFSQVGSDISPGVGIFEHYVPLYKRVNARYIFQTCFASVCADSSTIFVSGTLVGAIGYFKASNTGSDGFGLAVSLSGDGNTLAVGASGEDSNAIGINGDQADNSARAAGAVYVFTRSGTIWAQQAYIKASNTGSGDRFGNAVSLSDNGNTLAVGATLERSNATAINGDQVNNSAINAGAVYVFTRSGSTWAQQAYIKASNTDLNDQFANTVSLSDNGNTLAVGAWLEDSDATGINGDQADNSARDAGAVYVYTRSGTTWTQQAYIKASNTGSGDQFGRAVSLSGADGNTLAVGANREDSWATGINGWQADNRANSAGAVYVFTRSDTTWIQQAYIKASNTGIVDEFGQVVDLSDDGNTLAVGAIGESSNATGINGNQNNNFSPRSGAVYVYTRSGTIWSRQAYIKASNTGSGDRFGWAVSLSGDDGNTLAVSAPSERSNATGINGDQVDNSLRDAGAVYVYTRSGTTWIQQAYVKASNTGSTDQFGDVFGQSISLSDDGNTLAVGAMWESSNATGINGDQADNSAPQAGATYLY